MTEVYCCFKTSTLSLKAHEKDISVEESMFLICCPDRLLYSPLWLSLQTQRISLTFSNSFMKQLFFFLLPLHTHEYTDRCKLKSRFWVCECEKRTICCKWKKAFFSCLLWCQSQNVSVKFLLKIRYLLYKKQKHCLCVCVCYSLNADDLLLSAPFPKEGGAFTACALDTLATTNPISACVL